MIYAQIISKLQTKYDSKQWVSGIVNPFNMWDDGGIYYYIIIINNKHGCQGQGQELLYYYYYY